MNVYTNFIIIFFHIFHTKFDFETMRVCAIWIMLINNINKQSQFYIYYQAFHMDKVIFICDNIHFQNSLN